MAGWWIKFEAETGRRFYKIVLVVNGDIYIILLIYESRTQPLYYDRQYGWYKGTADRPQWETDCMEQSAYGEDDRSLAGHKFGQLNNIWWTVQTVKLITKEHLPLFLPVCSLTETTCTYHVHCATGSTLSLAISTQSVDRAADGTEVCPSNVSVICEVIDWCDSSSDMWAV